MSQRPAAPTLGSDPTSSAHGMSHPDPWVSLRINQAWGRASIAVLGHKNAASYYGATTPTGYPDDKWGWAVVSGIEIKLDSLSPGSRIGGYVTYGVGASRVTRNSQTSPGLYGSGNEVAFGMLTDAVYANWRHLELTTAWAAGGGFEYFWTRNFSSTIYGGYTRTEYNGNAAALVCTRYTVPAPHVRSELRPLAVGHAPRLVPGGWAPVCGRRVVHRRRNRPSRARPLPSPRRRVRARRVPTLRRTTASSRSCSAPSAAGAATEPITSYKRSATSEPPSRINLCSRDAPRCRQLTPAHRRGFCFWMDDRDEIRSSVSAPRNSLAL